MTDILGTPTPTTEAAPATTSAPAAEVTQAPTTPAPEWVSSIDVSLQGEQSLHKFKNQSELAKSYLEAQKFIGSDKIAIPGKYATPEEYKKVFSKLGLPESADKYEVNIKNKDLFTEADITALKTVAHANNLLPSQVQALAEHLEKDATEYNAKILEDFNQKVEADTKALQSEWGDKFNSKVEAAKFAVNHFGGDEMLSHIQTLGLSSDAKLIKFFAQVGEAFKGDGFPGSNQINSSGKLSSGEAMKQLDAMRMDPIAMDSNHPQHSAFVRDMERLAVVAHQESN